MIRPVHCLKAAALLSLGLAVLTDTAQAQVFSTPKNLTTNNRGLSSAPQIAVDASGNIYVVWETFDFGESDILLSRPTDGIGSTKHPAGGEASASTSRAKISTRSAQLAAAAVTIHVPTDQPTIQAAINAANNGDTVLVSDGTYKENINFNGKAIKVTSVNGATTTTIDGGKVDVVAKFVTAEGLSSVLDGFTITNGNGLGIHILSTSPTVKNNIVTANTGCPGIGILIGDGSPLIQNNTISNNAQLTCFGGDSAGITVGGPPSGAQIIGNTIRGNNSSLSTGGGGISLNAVGPVLIQGNLITRNVGFRGGGIGALNDTSQVRIIENVITSNTEATAGGIGIDNIVLLILSNTIAGNDAPGGGSAFLGHFFTTTGAMTISNNLFIGKPGQSAVDCRGFDTVSPPVFSFNDVFTSGAPNYGSTCIDQLGKTGTSPPTLCLLILPQIITTCSPHLQRLMPAATLRRHNYRLPTSTAIRACPTIPWTWVHLNTRR